MTLRRRSASRGSRRPFQWSSPWSSLHRSATALGAVVDMVCVFRSIEAWCWLLGNASCYLGIWMLLTCWFSCSVCTPALLIAIKDKRWLVFVIIGAVIGSCHFYSLYVIPVAKKKKSKNSTTYVYTTPINSTTMYILLADLKLFERILISNY